MQTQFEFQDFPFNPGSLTSQTQIQNSMSSQRETQSSTSAHLKKHQSKTGSPLHLTENPNSSKASTADFIQAQDSLLQALHQRALQASREHRSSESRLLEILCQVEDKKLHLHLHYSSVFEYCTKALFLTEAMALNLIAVARKSKSVPELKAAVMEGHLSVSTARKLTPVIEASNSSQWIEKAKTLTKARLEKEVATVEPKTLTPERARYVSGSRLELRMGLSEELHEKLKRAQDLLSQKRQLAASFEETLEVVLDKFLEKQDPLLRAKRVLQKAKDLPLKPESQAFERAGRAEGKTKELLHPKSSPYVSGHMERESPSESEPRSLKKVSRALPRRVQHQVLERDQGQCTYYHPETQQRCQNKRWLEVHHIQLFSQGGGHELHNLTTLCSAHHKLRH